MYIEEIRIECRECGEIMEIENHMVGQVNDKKDGSYLRELITLIALPCKKCIEVEYSRGYEDGQGDD